jgi:para-nitrobenzyl esterase
MLGGTKVKKLPVNSLTKTIQLTDPIKVETGYISGTLLGKFDKEVHVYRGIPYAAAPTGSLRWKPPQPAASWSDIRECTQFSIQPAQLPDENLSEEKKKLPSSEDCLYLNVSTPAKKTTDKLPVMVWFHGGGLRYGSGNYSLYNSLGLPDHDVILVTVNSRLGIVGLFAHPLLSQESPQGVSGNYLFLDLIASLKWVRRNIAAFGGDPDNVTIFGESGGGLKVLSLMASPLAKGLFHRAIVESGGRTFEPPKLKVLEKFGERLFVKLGIDKDKDPLASARAIPCEKLIEFEQALNMDLGPAYKFLGPWDLTEDGWFISDSIFNVFKTGKQNGVPYLLVSNMGELTGPGLVVHDHGIVDNLKFLAAPGKASSRGYAVVFDQVPDSWKKEGCVAAHAMEMHYVFGALDNKEAWETFVNPLYSLAGAKSTVPTVSNTDRIVSEAMMTIWAKFAKTGDPSVKGLIEVPPWDKVQDQYLLISDPLQIKSGYSDLAKIKSIKSPLSLP